MTIEIDVTNYGGEACASFDLPRSRMPALTITVEGGDVQIDGLEDEGETGSIVVPLDTLRAAIAAHDMAALWSYSVERDWERTDASGCHWQIWHEYRPVQIHRHDHNDFVYTVFRNDGDGFVQVGEPHATWGRAMFAAEGMVVR